MFRNQYCFSAVMQWCLLLFVSIILGLALVACGSKGDKKGDKIYLESKSVPPLEIPSDLKSLEQQKTYEIPQLSEEAANRPPVDPSELVKPPVFINIGHEPDEQESDDQTVIDTELSKEKSE